LLIFDNILSLGLPGESMSSWIEKRAEFQRRFDSLSQENIQALITELNTAVGNYISSAGLSQEPEKGNPLNIKITELIQRAENIKQRYSTINNDILTYLNNNAKDTNITGLLSENGELQKQINRLEKLQDKMKIDVETSVARDKLLRSRDTDVTPHQLFVLDRPIRKGLIPYLWVISVLFIGIGLVILKMNMPSLQINTTGTYPIYYMIMEFVTNKIVIGSLIASILIVILFLSLKVAGVFGK
jgi:hypothetical protein